MRAVSDDESAHLCTSCGFCCDGTLFSKFAVRGPEASWAERRGLRVIGEPGDLHATQPCGCFGADGRCSGYDTRPASCRLFVCRLLDKARKGEVTHEAAEAHVRRAKDLIQRIERVAVGHKNAPLFVRTEDRSGWSGDDLLNLFELVSLLKAEFGFDERRASSGARSEEGN
jgi:uncharacterized protein